jgi:hypothetical protein
MVTVCSSKVILKGAEVPGPHQSSAARHRDLRGLHSVERENGRLIYLAETKRGCQISSVRSGYNVDRVLEAGEVKGSFLPSVQSGCT